MKKFISLLVCIILLIAVISCQGKKEPAVDSAKQPGDDTAQWEATDKADSGEKPAMADTPGEPAAGELAEVTSTAAAATSAPAGAAAEEGGPTVQRLTTPRELSEEEVGQVIYLLGEVDIARNGIFLENVDIGSGVENFDVIRTGERSETELELSASGAPQTLLSLSENTAFTVEIGKTGATTRTGLELLTGDLKLKVSKLLPDQEFDVASDVAVVGVRGTIFAMATLPSGDLLVTCSDGRVLCMDKQDLQGEQVAAVPGQAVERLAGASLRAIELAGEDEDEFRAQWLEEKVRLLKDDALEQIRKTALAYEKYFKEFDARYEDLFSHAEIIERWIAEDRAGKISSSATQLMQDKKQLIGPLFDIRQSLVGLNRSYHRLLELEKYHAQGFGRGEIRAGLSTTQFYAQLNRQQVDEMLAQVQYVQKLFSLRNAGSILLDEFENMGLDDDSFFESDEGAFFGDDDF